mgnify:CR=1 FL=1
MKLTTYLAAAAMALWMAAAPLAHGAGWEMAGTKSIFVTTSEGQRLRIGTVSFTPSANDTVAFKLAMETERFTDYFLSMREFKCLSGPAEVVCYVPYPHRQPGTITRGNLAWLEHNLMFFYKQSSDFGAKLWNGIYFQLQPTETGLVGKPQSIDLNVIGAPPQDDNPPYSPALRDDMPVAKRWIQSLSIE